MVVPLAYAASRRNRPPPSLPFGWGAVTVVLVGAILLIIGIGIILYGFIGFFSGTFAAAIGMDFSLGSFFNSFFGAIILFVVGGVLAGAGGWLIRLWWIFLLIGVATGAASGGNTVRDREAMRQPDVRLRCLSCGRLNPEDATFCLSCGQKV